MCCHDICLEDDVDDDIGFDKSPKEGVDGGCRSCERITED